MKLFTKVNAIGLVLASFVIGSCSTSNNVVNGGLLSKRKYKKGYHYNAPGSLKTDKTETASKDVKIKVVATEEAVAAQNEVVKTTTPVVVEQKAVTMTEQAQIRAIESIVTSTETVKVSKVQKAIAKKIVNNSLKKQASINKAFNNKNDKDSSSREVEKGLYIVLCILLPWVAVGLATDWDIKVVIINVLWSILCFFPAVIHAFVVCKREGAI